jgi:fumarate hydratase subunit beta
MSDVITVATPLDDGVIDKLTAGVRVLINGIIYTARDAAHQRLKELIDHGEKLPFEPRGQVIYYVGPAPPKPGMAMGAAGPTSSYRMDPYAPGLMKLGLKAMIGKGQRGPQVLEALKRHRAVYLAATGGAGALLAASIKKARIIAYEDLGPEAIRELTVENFPVIVANDAFGGDIFRQGQSRYAQPELAGL